MWPFALPPPIITLLLVMIRHGFRGFAISQSFPTSISIPIPLIVAVGIGASKICLTGDGQATIASDPTSYPMPQPGHRAVMSVALNSNHGPATQRIILQRYTMIGIFVNVVLMNQAYALGVESIRSWIRGLQFLSEFTAFLLRTAPFRMHVIDHLDTRFCRC